MASFTRAGGRSSRKSSSSALHLGDEGVSENVKSPPRGSDKPTSPNARNIATSVTSFFSKLRPSKRPERGGTTIQFESLAVQTTNRRQSTGSLDNNEADFIPPGLWNMPIAIPRRSQSISSRIAANVPATTAVELPASPVSDIPAGVSNSSHISSIRGAIPSRKPLPKAAPTPADQDPVKSSDRARELFLAKQEARRQRRTLKESSDFLGVTGVNPYTGEMDVLTPTTSSDELRPAADPYLAGLARKAEDAQEAYELAKREAQQKREQAKHDKIERHKDAIRLAQQRVKWRRETLQWSSVAEPNLSPIPQSQKSSASQSSGSTTIHRKPSSFLGLREAATNQRRLTLEEPKANTGPAVETQQENQQQQHQHQPQHQSSSQESDGSQASVISSPSETTTFRLRSPPSIPVRLGPTLKDTSPVKTLTRVPKRNPIRSLMNSMPKDFQVGPKPRRLIDMPIPQPHGQRSLLGQPLPRIPSGRILELENQNPSDLWANTLIGDLGNLEPRFDEERETDGRSLTTSRSACTLTTITTGYEPSLPRPEADRGCEEKASRLSEGRAMAAWMAPLKPALPLSLDGPPSNACLDLLASPPGGMRQSVWPSLDCLPPPTLEIATVESTPKMGSPPQPSPPPASVTTLASEAPPTADCKRQVRHVSSSRTELRKTMRTSKEQQTAESSISSLMCTSTSPLGRPSSSRTISSISSTGSSIGSGSGSGSNRTNATLVPGDAELDLAMVQGAARTAYVQHVIVTPAAAKLVSCGAGTGARKKASPEAVSDRSRDRHGFARAGEDGEEVMGAAPPPQPPAQGRLAPPGGTGGTGGRFIAQGQVGLALLQELVQLVPVRAFWKLVRPVFDPRSALRKRYARGQSTGEDCIVWLLAWVFVLVAGSAVLWVVKAVVWMCGVLGKIVPGF
ncbi:hypothetical protein B0T19DRAFT_224087 [Cercophora scortea]|uniref:Uncharacterized protein n=1 Tax=Cercophora scortea TaxID=314031 RepID=A0AAE0IFT1_9PEZI|nr:hypothetical protein B0T19DRAFT_224087 [Cercophora scortea]